MSLSFVGAFWLTFGATLQPFYFAYGNYSPNPHDELAGLTTTGFLNSFGTQNSTEFQSIDYIIIFLEQAGSNFGWESLLSCISFVL